MPLGNAGFVFKGMSRYTEYHLWEEGLKGGKHWL